MLQIAIFAPMRSIRNPSRQLVEDRYGRPIREILLDLTYRKSLSQLEIARLLQVPEGTVHSWFLREGIQAGQLAQERADELLQTQPELEDVG